MNRRAKMSSMNLMGWCCLLVAWTLWLPGCLFTGGGVDDEPCEPARRCVAPTTPVCGVDGLTYACAELARCERVEIDPTGAACGGGTCEPVTCEIGCQHGLKTDADGCEICECADPPVCPDLACAIYCEYGFETGPDGCPTCACADPPECPAIGCRLACEHGYEKDENGCDLCECAEPKECPDVARCPEEEGCYIEDTPDGCGRCVCDPISCPDIQCEEPGLIECREYAIDDNGCQTCECVAPVCPDIACDATVECPWGYQEDEYGCQTCECAESPECGDGGACNLYCEDGYKQDENGCDLCECVEDEPVCQPVACALFCAHGFARDEDGCEVCVCLPGPACESNSDCEWEQICQEAAVTPSCCPEGLECPPGMPVCEPTCQPRERCDDTTPCPPGSMCQSVERDDCCGPDELCAADIPACPTLCL